MSRRHRAQLVGRGWRLRRAVVAGAGPNVSITVTGLYKGDEIISVIEYQGTTTTSGDTVAADRTAVASIYANNTLRLSVTSAGRQLDVMWNTRY